MRRQFPALMMAPVILALIATAFIATSLLLTFGAPFANAAPIDTRMPPAGDWRSLTHGKLHFKIAYPGNVFHPSPVHSSDAGSLLVSPDGLAKLMIAAFDNDVETSLADYRQHVLKTSYSGAAIDYAPVRRSWFVLSGTRDGMIFYERVSFTCGGRRITSWAMLYPYEQRHYYSPILEQIARTFRPSRSPDGSC